MEEFEQVVKLRFGPSPFEEPWDGVCLQSKKNPSCAWDVKFAENGDVVTACYDGVVPIWTVSQDNNKNPTEFALFASQLFH